VLIALGFVVVGLIVGGIIFMSGSGLTLPFSGPDPTPTLSPELAEKQLMYTSSHYTTPRPVAVGCLLGCKEVSFNLTFITEKLVEDMVWADLTSRGIFDNESFEMGFTAMKSQLKLEDYLVFALTITPGKSEFLSTGSEIKLGPLHRNLVLLTTGDNVYSPVEYDILFDQPLSLKSSHKGYIFFPRKDDSGKPLSHAPSLALRLNLSESLNSKQTAITWNFDLLSPPPVVKPAAMPTPGPSPTPGGPTSTPLPPLIDRDVILAVLELFTELSKSD
jgi:hypothetical protein